MSTPSTPPPPPIRRLERSHDDRVLAGVCGGLGHSFGIDPTLVRVAAAILLLLGGLGAVAYLAAWLLVPEEGDDVALMHRGATVNASPLRLVAGAGLLAIAVVIVSGGSFPGLAGPLLLGLTGALLLLLPSRPGPGPRPATAAAAPAPGAVAAPDPSTVASAAADPATAQSSLRGFATPAYGGAPAPPAPAPPPPPRRRRPAAPIAFGLLLIGTAAVAAVATSDVGLGAREALAIVVILVGAALAGAALWGGSPGLIVVGFLVAALVAVPITADIHLRGGVGNRTIVPPTAAAIPATYHLAAGRVRLDLRRALRGRATAGPIRVTKVDVGLGRLLVIVPAGARVTVDAHVSVGNLEVVDKASSGTDVRRHATFGPTDGPPLHLDLHVAAGSLEVRRGNPPWPNPRDEDHAITGSLTRPTLPTDRSHHAAA